jgi:putative Mn2+ efflux pump MntP
LSASTIIKTLGLVLSLGFDTFAVAVGLGMSGLSRHDRYRYGAAFAIAEGCMPLVGFLLGLVVASFVGNIASYAAVVLLLAVGVYAMWEASHDDDPEYAATTLGSMLVLALSVSLDELAVGFTLGLLHIPILLACVLIALQAFAVTLVGTTLGTAIGEKVVQRAGLLSGLVLTLLALFLLSEKVFAA